ncbi:MAG: hypothetical protein AAGC53_16410 [Actinomycetota bacterium]
MAHAGCHHVGDGRWVEAFGGMVIPRVVALAFALIIGMLVLMQPTPEKTA